MVNVKPKQLGKNTRMSFGKINEALEPAPSADENGRAKENFYEHFVVEIFL